MMDKEKPSASRQQIRQMKWNRPAVFVTRSGCWSPVKARERETFPTWCYVDLTCLCASHLHPSIWPSSSSSSSSPCCSPALWRSHCTRHLPHTAYARVFMSLPVIIYTGFACNIHYAHESAECSCPPGTYVCHRSKDEVEFCPHSVVSALPPAHTRIHLNAKSNSAS